MTRLTNVSIMFYPGQWPLFGSWRFRARAAAPVRSFGLVETRMRAALLTSVDILQPRSASRAGGADTTRPTAPCVPRAGFLPAHADECSRILTNVDASAPSPRRMAAARPATRSSRRPPRIARCARGMSTKDDTDVAICRQGVAFCRHSGARKDDKCRQMSTKDHLVMQTKTAAPREAAALSFVCLGRTPRRCADRLTARFATSCRPRSARTRSRRPSRRPSCRA